MQRLLRWVAGLLGLAALLFALGIGAFRLAIERLTRPAAAVTSGSPPDSGSTRAPRNTISGP